MLKKQKHIEGTTIESLWNRLAPLGRLIMILNTPDHFLSLGLVTRDELSRVMEASDTELEYILTREDQPLFQNINLKQTLATQTLRLKIKAALQAVLNCFGEIPHAHPIS